MKELNNKECNNISGGRFVPDIGTLLINVAMGVVGGIIFGATAGPVGMITGAIAGGAIAAGGQMSLDAYQISKDRKN